MSAQSMADELEDVSRLLREGGRADLATRVQGIAHDLRRQATGSAADWSLGGGADIVRRGETIPGRGIVPPTPELEATFQALADTWRRATGHLSDDLRMFGHPAYQSIISMGPDVVPLILHELETRRGHWFDALRAITHEDPDQEATSVPEAREAWLQWGRRHGYS